MCIVLWSIRKQSGYMLVILSNRDEFLSRSTKNASWHSFKKEEDEKEEEKEEEKEVISGIDLIGGGTWLGYCKKLNKFGFLTNIANPNETKNSKWISRGNLLKNYFIDSSTSVKSYIKELRENHQMDLMDGFNLVIGEISENFEKVEIEFHCNRQSIENIQINQNQNQNHQIDKYENGMSNGIKSEKEIEWNKVKLGKDLLTKRLIKECDEQDEEKLIDDLFNILSQTDPNDEALPQNILIRPYHRLTSTSNIPNRQTWYGTKTQTLVLVSMSKRVTFIERDAFAIIDTPDHLGSPVWLGDDRKSWRRFEFDIA
ncbi:NRDE protein-domain-containing protein [Melampsora americana]|nr:NRDE protein-domain-containing protein [Melampsora americana]